MSFSIGVDGGGTKTASILVGPNGRILARRTGPGCNPSSVGAGKARRILLSELRALKRSAKGEPIGTTLLCMAGSPSFWREVARGLRGFGEVRSTDDSVPVLELAVGSGHGIVLHAGTGSFVAARTRSGEVHYAGGLGWRFGDPGSGTDIGRRAAARAILELQGWAPRSGLSALVRRRTGLRDAAAITRWYYSGAPRPADIAELAPAVLSLAARGDPAARRAVSESVGDLVRLAEDVARRLFPGRGPVRSGLSGRILTHPAGRRAVGRSARLRFSAIGDPPIEGVRRMLSAR